MDRHFEPFTERGYFPDLFFPDLEFDDLSVETRNLAPPRAEAIAAMTRCNHCGTNNLDGSEYCDECGTKLTPAEQQSPRQPSAPPAQFITQVAPPPPPSFTKDSVAPKPATPFVPPPPTHSSAGQSSPADLPGDQAVGPPSRGHDQVREQSPKRAADPALRSITNPAAPPAPPAVAPPAVAPPVAAPAANFPAPPNVTDAEASRAQSGGQPPGQTGAFNGRTNALRGASDSDGGRRRAAGDEKNRQSLSAKVIIQRGGKVGKEFPISGTEALIGRWDADGGIFPDIDLDQDDPEAKVSRRHARIQFLNNQYQIEDLGSTNGTFVNRGPRLAPGAKQPLKNGDEIIVGKTFLKFVTGQ